jgi:hypothetical protein
MRGIAWLTKQLLGSQEELGPLEFLGAFAKLRKGNINFVMSVCPSVRPSAMNHSAPTERIFMKFYIGVFLENLLRKFKCHWNLTRITVTLLEDLNTFMIISSWIRLRMRNVSDKVVKKTQKTHFMFNNLFFPEIHGFYEIMCKNIVESYEPQITVWHMSFACWITDVINTHSEYVIFIFCPWQQWLLQRP